MGMNAYLTAKGEEGAIGHYRLPQFSAGTKKGPEGPFFTTYRFHCETCRSLFGAGNETRIWHPTR